MTAQINRTLRHVKPFATESLQVPKQNRTERHRRHRAVVQPTPYVFCIERHRRLVLGVIQIPLDFVARALNVRMEYQFRLPDRGILDDSKTTHLRNIAIARSQLLRKLAPHLGENVYGIAGFKSAGKRVYSEWMVRDRGGSPAEHQKAVNAFQRTA